MTGIFQTGPLLLVFARSMSFAVRGHGDAQAHGAAADRPERLRSLEAACAPPSVAALVSHARSRGTGNPARALFQPQQFLREDHA